MGRVEDLLSELIQFNSYKDPVPTVDSDFKERLEREEEWANLKTSFSAKTNSKS